MNNKAKIIKDEKDWDEYLHRVMATQNNQIQNHSGKPEEFPCIVISHLNFDQFNGYRFLHSFVYTEQAEHLIDYKKSGTNE